MLLMLAGRRPHWLPNRSRFRLLLAVLLPLTLPGPKAVFAQQASVPLEHYATPPVFDLEPPLSHLSGEWGGLRSKLEHVGIIETVTFVNDFEANPIGGNTQGQTAPSSIAAGLVLDFGKMHGPKDGFLFVTMTYRWGTNLSTRYIGNVFQTQQEYGFETVRLLNLGYAQKLFNDRVELGAGRFSPADNFLISTYDVLFVQNGFCGNPVGISFNAPGFIAYSGSWGALGTVKPTKRSYVMAAAFNGNRSSHANSTHGVDFSLRGPLFAMGEIGYKINGLSGDTRRPGNYKLGGWYDRARIADFNSGAKNLGSWGTYALFDQLLATWGVPSANKGFGVFGSVTVAPNTRIQEMPFFATAGVVVRGIAASRPDDTIGLGLVYGDFSKDLQRAQQAAQLLNPSVGIQKHEVPIELTDRIFFHKRAFFLQPDLQYIFKPGATGRIGNALVAGMQTGINF